MNRRRLLGRRHRKLGEEGRIRFPALCCGSESVGSWNLQRQSAVAARESDINVMKLEGKKEKKNTELIMMTPV